jgi:hypothetical protein
MHPQRLKPAGALVQHARHLLPLGWRLCGSHAQQALELQPGARGRCSVGLGVGRPSQGLGMLMLRREYEPTQLISSHIHGYVSREYAKLDMFELSSDLRCWRSVSLCCNSYLSQKLPKYL